MAKFIQAISDEKRIRILKMLERRPMCVCQLTAVLGIKQPTVSKHIGKLKKAGIIMEKRIGQFRLCIMNREHQYINIWWIISSFAEKNELAQDLKKVEEVLKTIQPKFDSHMAIH
ncbi:MAG: metalloregulator ArsR/SmtB family transcription factor [Candidatus Omnitrophica bacterium]|nr:metalloregulator ArsR/SmtB family transcription factor [Candidatus Omnitrophota bacterium]